MRDWDPNHRLVLSVNGADLIEAGSVPECNRAGPPNSPVEIYRPQGEGARPAVLFVHGDGKPDALTGISRSGQYVSWGQTVAVNGLVGVTFEHSSSEELTEIQRVMDEIDAVLDCLRANADQLGVDPDRVCLWSCSAGVPFGISTAFRRATQIRCAVAYYGWLDLRGMRPELPSDVSDAALASASPLAFLESGVQVPPLLVVMAGMDRASINDSIDAFMTEARRSEAHVELLVHSSGRHAFDVLDDVDESRTIIEATIAFMKEHLSV